MTDLERRLKRARDATADAGASSEHSETDLERMLRIAHEEKKHSETDLERMLRIAHEDKKQYTRSGEYRRNALQNRTESFMDIVTQGETAARAGIDRYKANRDADYYQQMNKAGVTYRDQDMLNRSVTGYKGAYDLWKSAFDRETDAAAARTRREREMTENPAKAPTVSDIVSRYSGKTKTLADLGNNVRGAIDAYKRQSDAAKAAPTPEEARQQAEESVQYWQNVAREAARYGDVYRQATAKKHLADSVENYSRATKGYFDNLKNTDPGTYYALTMTPEEIDRELELLNNGAYLDSKITNSLTNDERIMGEYWHRTPQEQRQYEHNLERARFAGETDDERNAYISSEKEAYRDARNRMLNDASVEGSVGSNQEPYNRREEITQANEARKSVLENARLTQKVIQAEREGITNDPQIIASGKQKFEKDQQEIWDRWVPEQGWVSPQAGGWQMARNPANAVEHGYVLDRMDEMTEEQRARIYSLYDRDPETALKLAQTYAKALDDKVYQEIFDWVAKDSGWQFGRRAVGNLAGAVMNLASGLDPFGYGGQSAGKVGDALIGGAAQSATRNGWFGIEELGGDQSWIDSSVPFIGRGRAGEASQLVSSMEQSALTTLPAMVAGRYDAAAASWLETAGLLLQSSSAARSDYRESIEAGLDDTTAKIHAVAAGIAEYTFEKVSFDKLLAQNTSRMTFKKVMKDVLVQAGIEGSEELHTTLANTIMDEIISGDGKSKIDRRIAELVQGGMSMKEAKGVAEKEWLTGIVNDFIGGAASGGIMTGAHYAVGATVNTAENKIANNAVNQLVGQYAGAQTENFTDADTIEAAKNYAEARGIDASGLTEAAAMARDASVDEAMSALRGSTQSETETKSISKRDSRKAGKAWTEIRTQISQDFDGKSGAQAAQLYDQMAEQYGAGIKTIVDEVVTTQARQSYLEQSQTAQELQQKVKPQVDALPEGGYKQASMRAYDQAEYQLRQQEAAKTADRLAKAGNIDTEVTYTNKDGSETTAQIADLSDDLTSVVLDNGETVPIKDVQMSADTASAIRIFSRIAGKKAASLAFREYRAYLNNGGTEGYRFAEAVATAYGQGLNGVLTPEQALKMAPDFAQEAAERAFNAGRQKHQASIENEQARRKAAEEKAKAEGAQTVKGELRGVDSIKWEKMNATRRTRAQNQIKYLDSIAQGIGVDIELFQSEATRRGKRMAYRGEQGAWYVDKATGKPVIRIDVNAGANFISDLNAALIATTGHELAHHFQHISPAVYDEYRQAVVQAILSTENGYEKLQRLIEHEKRINRRADGTTISTDAAIDEVVADASRDRVGDRNLWKNVADSMSDESRGKVAQWLHDRFSKILKLTKRYAGFEAADLVLQSAQEYQDLIGELWQKLTTQAANAVDVREGDYPAPNDVNTEAETQEVYTERYSSRVEDQSLRDRVSDLEDQLDMAELNGLSQAEIRKLNNELIKARGQLDSYTANQRRQAKRTSFNEILRNLENYERVDLESLAEQISDSAWDDYNELSDEELIDALRETINERLDDFAPGDADNPKYGLFVKKPKTAGNISVVRNSERDAEYLEAVESNEDWKVEKMVRDAAVQWGAATDERGKPIPLYHGTPRFGFTVFKDPAHEVPFIYTSTNPTVSAHYAGDKNYAGRRPIGRKYRTGTKTEDIIENAKWVYESNFHVMSTEEKLKAYKEIEKQVIEIADKLDEVHIGAWNAESEAFKNMPDEVANAISWVEDMFWTIRDSDYKFNFDGKEDYPGERAEFFKVLDSDIENAKTQRAIVQEFYNENRKNLSKREKAFLSYLLSYEVGDAAIDIEYKLRRVATENDVIMNEAGNINNPLDLKESMDMYHETGAYTLYGNLGDNPFIFDANGAQFWGVKVPEMGDGYYSTDSISKWAYENGYTGVVMKNIYDYGDKADNYVFFNSSQLKSADPVTYDDQGNVIPLSERFNPKNDDIRYSERDYGQVSDLDVVESLDEKKATTPEAKALIREAKEKAEKIRKLEARLAEVQSEKSGWKGRANRNADLMRMAMESKNRDIANLEKQIRHAQDILVGKIKNTSIQRMIAEARDTATAKARAQAQERFANQKENRKRGELRARIINLADEIQRTATRPTESKYVPASLYGAMSETLGMVSDLLESDNTKGAAKRLNIGQKILELKNEYEKIKSLDDAAIKSEYDEDISMHLGEIETVLRRVGLEPGKSYHGMTLRDLPTQTLQDLYDEISAIYKSMRDARKALAGGRAVDISTIQNSIIEQQAGIDSLNEIGKIGKLARNSMLDGLSTMRAVEMMSGWNRNAALYKTVSRIEDGAAEAARWSMNYNKRMQPLKTGKNELTYRNALTKRLDWQNAKDMNSGKPVKMTKLQALQIYMSWLREESDPRVQHLHEGGTATIRDARDVLAGKASRAASNDIRVTPELMQEIKQSLTEWDQQYMDAIHEYMTEEGEATNKIHYQVKHKVLKTSENYFPEMVNKDYVDAKLEETAADNLWVMAPGATNELRPGAKQPIIIDGTETVMAAHVRDMANYIGLALPIRDFAKILNGKVATGEAYATTIRSSISPNFGQKGIDVLKHAAMDVQGGRKVERKTQIERYLNGLHGAFVRSTLLINPSVTIKQAASYAATESILSYRAVVAGNRPIFSGSDNSHSTSLIAQIFMAPDSKTAQRIYDEIDEHTALHYQRRQGMSYEELAHEALRQSGWKTTKANLGARMEQNAVGRIVRKTGARLSPVQWIQRMDVATTAAIWVACKTQSKIDGFEAGTQEFWNHTTQLYERCLRETQPMYDPLHRSERQKGGGLMQYLFPFRTVPFQNHGQIVASFEAMKAAKGTSRAKEATRFFRKTVVAQVKSAIVFSALSMLAAGLRHKPDEYMDENGEVDIGAMLGKLGIDTASTLFSVIFPLTGSETWEFGESQVNKFLGKDGKQWDIFSVGAVEMLNDMFTAAGNVVGDAAKAMQGEKVTKDSFKNHVTKLLLETSAVLGIPLENIKKYSEGIVKDVGEILDGKIPAFNNDAIERDTATNIDRYLKAWSAGDEKKRKAVLEELRGNLSASGKDEKEVDASIRENMNAEAKKMLASGTWDIEKAILFVRSTGAYDDDAVNEKVKEWCKQAYASGRMSDEEAIAALKKYATFKKEYEAWNAVRAADQKRDYLRTAFLDGKKNKRETVTALQNLTGMDEEYASRILDQWNAEKDWKAELEYDTDKDFDFREYADLYSAFAGKKDIGETIRAYKENGYSDKQMNDNIPKAIKAAYSSGALSESKAIQLLTRYVTETKNGEIVKMDENSAWDKVNGWAKTAEHTDENGDVEEGYSYSRNKEIFDAINANKDIKGLVEQYAKHSDDPEKTRKDIMSDVKTYLVDRYAEGKTASESALKNQLSRYCGIVKSEDVNAIVTDAKCKRDTGYYPDKLSEGYRDGKVTKEQALKALVSYNGLSASEAKARVRAWDFQKEHPDLKWDSDRVDAYYDKRPEGGGKSAYEAGISVETYDDYRNRAAKAKGVDANGDGRTDSGSKKAEILRIIDSLDISRSQKDALYYINGWAASTIYEAPWH